MQSCAEWLAAEHYGPIVVHAIARTLWRRRCFLFDGFAGSIREKLMSSTMRHHFGDLLNREEGYWTVVPNRERYAYRIGDVPVGSPEITIVTIGKDDEHWERALTLPNLEELTLHEPTHEQLLAVEALWSLKRLRVTHARPKTIDFI